ncbi:MAG: carboxypeptidase M32 [Rhodobiaceae bacterium]|nr:carboxypeptidase M32 [Rhodobiaceae bacterium]
MTDAYHNLMDRFATIADVDAASAILSWDKATIMPDGGAATRARTLATLSTLSHRFLTEPVVAALLAEAKAPDDPWHVANLREMKRAHAQATALPGDLVERLSMASSDSEMVWRSARAADDFAALAPKLDTLIGLIREKAAALSAASGLASYDALLDTYDPGRRSEDIDIAFDDLAAFLPGLLDTVIEKQAREPAILKPEGPFAVDVQKALGEAVMAVLGFDFNRGRLDTSHHPFTGGLPDDSRLTTRYREDDFTSSLMGVIHETGHALYEQGRPAQWRRQPVGESYGMAVHESQSLLFEMQAGRSRPFIAWLAPKLRERFGDGPAFALDNLYRIYHRVGRGLIRVDADEISYPLHVILRYRLEKALLSGDLKVADLPGAWNDGMQELVGITPPDDRDGCMQDIHWPMGAIGYFPTYTLGAMGAAQLFQAARAAMPNLEDDIGEGRFGPLLGWLREAIHGRGRRDAPGTVIEKATGQPLDATAIKLHLEARYLNGA